MYNYYLGENSLNYFSEENKTVFNVFRVMVLMYEIGMRLLRDYERQRKSGVQPRLNLDDYKDLDIDEAAWRD